MKILIVFLLLGGAKEKIKVSHFEPPKEIRMMEGNIFEIREDFKFRPFRLNIARDMLRIKGDERIYTDFSLKPTFKMEYGEILYDFKEGKAKIPSVTFNSYCEIKFWENIYPHLIDAQRKIKEISKKSDITSLDTQREIMKIKEDFHKKFFEKRIEVMEKLGNEELKAKTYEAYEKYMKYKAKEEK
ncbi:MAG: hypothetical protein ABIM62_05755 [candidate division WOR-3 bacterium]